MLTGDLDYHCKWDAYLFYGVRRNALFCRSWLPVTGELKGILIIIHGLNEHSGRYAQFAKQLTSSSFGVYAMDWIGGFLGKDKVRSPLRPLLPFWPFHRRCCYFKGNIQAETSYSMKLWFDILYAVILVHSQFKGANKRGIPVSRDPAALLAKYSDPLVYTGPIRVRTGHEILHISSYLMRNFKSVTVPFFVLHGTADKVTDPLASQDLYNQAPSKFKDIKLYDGFLHDLLFEPGREEIGLDIFTWMEKRLGTQSEIVYNHW